MSKNRTPKSLRFEQLENRELMAGDVTVYMSSDGNLNIVEKSGHVGGAQAVQISQLSNGMVRVKGIANLAGGTTLVDGQEYKQFVVTGDIVANLGQGNDSLRVVANGSYNGLNINMGTEMLKGKTDNDRVFIENITTRGGVTVSTGAGTDYVSVTDAQIGNDYSDKLIVKMGSGSDTFNLQGLQRTVQVKGQFNLYMYNAETEVDRDYVYMDNAAIWSGHITSTGAGEDTVTIKRFTTGNDLVVSTGNDKDIARLTEVSALDELYVLLGSGDDTLELIDGSADTAYLDGGTGIDTQNRYNMGPVNSWYQSGWERGNAVVNL